MFSMFLCGKNEDWIVKYDYKETCTCKKIDGINMIPDSENG